MSASTLRVVVLSLVLAVGAGVLGFQAWKSSVATPSAKGRMGLLRLGNAAERREAAIELGNLGPEAGRDAVPALVASLKDSDASVRAVSAAALAQVDREDPKAEGALIDALKDSSERVRIAAADALAERPTPAAKDPLVAATKDSAPAVRAASARALGRIKDLKSADADALVALFRDTDPGVRHSTFLAVDERARPAKAKDDPRARQYEALALSAVADPSPRLRRVAALSLSQRPEGCINDADALAKAEVAALGDEDAQVRTLAVIAIGTLPKTAGPKLGAEAARALVEKTPDLIAGVIGSDPRARGENQAALVAVGTIARASKFQPDAATAGKIRESITKALDAPQPDLRPTVLSILPAVAPLTGAGPELLKTNIKSALDSQDERLHRAGVTAAKDVLDLAGSDDETTAAIAIEFLRPMLTDKDPQTRSVAYTSLWRSPLAARVGGEALVNELHAATLAWIAALKEGDTSVREVAAWCLGWTDRQDVDAAIAGLVRAKDDKEERVKARATKSLGRLEAAKTASADWPAPSWEPFRAAAPPRPMPAGGPVSGGMGGGGAAAQSKAAAAKNKAAGR